MRLLKILLPFLIVCTQWNLGLAKGDAGLPGEFMNFGTGARAQGMGRAYTGVSDDIDALFWNPAGLATFRSSQVGFQYSPLTLGGAHQYLAYAQPVHAAGSIGIGILNLTSGDIPRVDSNNVENGSYDNRETAYMASYAHRIKNVLSLGGTIKMAEKNIDGSSARGFGVDTGAMYLFKERARAGVMLRNLVPPAYNFSSEKETFPVILRMGTSANFFNKHLLAALDFDKTVGTAQNLKWHMGLEGTLFGSLFIRGGIDGTGFMTGIGVRWRSLQIDYAAGFQDLGLVNRTSMKFVFGGFELEAKASPKVFSPTGLKKVTTFKISSGNRQRVTSWILAIRNANNDVVRSFNGYNEPPKTLEWDGKDAQGQVVADGTYSYRLSVTDNKNVVETTPARSVRIVSPTPFEIEAK